MFWFPHVSSIWFIINPSYPLCSRIIYNHNSFIFLINQSFTRNEIPPFAAIFLHGLHEMIEELKPRVENICHGVGELSMLVKQPKSFFFFFL